MSKIRYNAVMNSHAGTTITARFILSILADKAKDDGYCYPGPEWLARRVNCDVSTVRRAIRALNEEGSLLTRKNGTDSLRKYEHLVLVGLSLHEIQAALQKYFEADSARMMMAIQQQSPLYFPCRMHEKDAECTEKKVECTKKNAECTKKNAECTKKMQNAARSVKDPSKDPSEDPSEDPLERDLALSRSRSRIENQMKKKSRANNTNKSNPVLKEIVAALYEACDKRASRRNSQKFRACAARLQRDGFNVAQISLTRRWWDSVGLGSIGGTPPWPEQIEENILAAIRWSERGQTSKTSSVEESKMAPINTSTELSQEQKRAIRANIAARRAKKR